MIESDELDKFLVQSEKELEELGKKFSFIDKLYFSEKSNNAVTANHTSDPVEIKRSSAIGSPLLSVSVKSSSTATTTKVSFDVLNLSFPMKLKFSPMIPQIYDLLLKFIQFFIQQMSLESLHEHVPFLKKVRPAKSFYLFLFYFCF